MEKQQTAKNQEATVYVGNLDERVNDAILWELFLQVAPVKKVYMPKDRLAANHQGFGFVEFYQERDAEYAVKIMNLVRVWGKPIRVNKATSDKKNLDVGANLFVGNLSHEVDESVLYDTFSSFGKIIHAPKIGRDEAGNHKGFGFVSFDSFESSDMAIAALNGQWLNNRQITVSYAFKKDGRGERHGTAAERLLAAQQKKSSAERAQAAKNLLPQMPVLASNPQNSLQQPQLVQRLVQQQKQ
ncbi:hypothetical protein MP228_007492 [Amoeboaphelidium protococcarum]|nr:hypothetical protein MP228_007492 [Amoeboaphelidium protococcarum]